MDLTAFPSTEAEFRTRFADEDRCRDYLTRLKWQREAQQNRHGPDRDGHKQDME